MADMVEEQRQNVLVRLTNLPLVSSTYDKVSSAYVTTKDNHPYLKSVCDVAETTVKTITSVAMTSTEPLLQRLEPQIALANNIACAGLDKLEEKLPILHQPSEKVVANASDAIVGAKDAVLQKITGAVDKTKGAVQDGVERTKAVVNTSISTVLESNVATTMSNRVDAALSKSETFLEQYLPPTDEELANEATKTEGFEVSQDEASYYVRLGSLSTKARKRAYQQALTRIKDAKCRSQEAIAQLQITVDLIEYARKNMDDASQKIHNAQEQIYNKWMEWTKGTGQNAGGTPKSSEHIESHTLAVACNLGQRLQATCLSLVTGIRGLPQDIQKKAQNVSALAADVYHNFQNASSFREMSDGLLSTTKEHLAKMKASLDEVMDYLVKNTPLNWLVAFYPHLAGSQEEEQDVDGEDSATKEAGAEHVVGDSATKEAGAEHVVGDSATKEAGAEHVVGDSATKEAGAEHVVGDSATKEAGAEHVVGDSATKEAGAEHVVGDSATKEAGAEHVVGDSATKEAGAEHVVGDSATKEAGAEHVVGDSATKEAGAEHVVGDSATKEAEAEHVVGDSATKEAGAEHVVVGDDYANKD